MFMDIWVEGLDGLMLVGDCSGESSGEGWVICVDIWGRGRVGVG